MLKPSYALCLCFDFCQTLWPLIGNFSYSHDQHHVHIHSHAILYHWKIAIISIHSQNKTPSSIMTLSPRLPSRIWAIQNEIKDAYPKKVWHMPKRHDKKKRKECKKEEKMHTQRRYTTCPQDMLKKIEKKGKIYSRHSIKKYKEREIIQRSSSTIHQ